MNWLPVTMVCQFRVTNLLLRVVSHIHHPYELGRHRCRTIMISVDKNGLTILIVLARCRFFGSNSDTAPPLSVKARVGAAPPPYVAGYVAWHSDSCHRIYGLASCRY